MEQSSILFFTVSAVEDSENTLIGRSWENTYSEWVNFFYYHNKDNKSLSELYNDKIRYAIDEEYDYIVFCHDDVTLDFRQLYENLYNSIGDESEYAIMGVAGNTKCKIIDKNLWHIMGDKNSMSGAVAHYTGKDDTECFMTSFGATPKRCILLDGVFLALNIKKISEVGLRFDENLPSNFHFYDLDFCLNANKLGLRMTTWPFWITHQSHGLSDINHKEWNLGNEYFKKKWGE